MIALSRIAAGLSVAALFGVLLPWASSTAQTPGNYADRPDVREFIEEICRRDDLKQAAVRETLAQAQYEPAAIRAMEPLPPQERSWLTYRSRFVNERRIREGLQFWQDHREPLARAQRQYGVPAEIIVAILGVETEYGQNIGDFRALDALATLAFDYPRRESFFRKELEHFLILVRDEHLAAGSLRGSYAGAIGIPQFMPGSILEWGVDFDGDGKRDLISSAADAIGSVANFLSKHGWQRGQLPAVPAEVSGDLYRPLLDLGVLPFVSARDLPDYAVKALVPLSSDTPVALVELDSPHQPSSFYLGLQNFYAVTRYNQSSFYAMAVLELAREIKVGLPPG